MWRETTKHKRNLKIWHEELDHFVPRKVLDFHVHLVDAESIPPGQTCRPGGHQIASYGFDDLKRDMSEAYPGRETYAVCFGSPNEKFDRSRNNAYVAANCDRKRFFPLRLIDPAEDPAEVRRDVGESGFLGFKPYLNYVRKADPNLVEIHEMLPARIMEIADAMGLLVMLHIPRTQRLADPVNQTQIVEICQAYPRAKVVLAHIGRAYYLKNVLGNLDRLKVLGNLYLDLAMLNNWEVLAHAFSVFPAERILHATDIPVALAPGKSVEINDQYTYVTPVPWHLSISDDHGRLVFTSFLYEQLRAVKKAVEHLGLGQGFVEGLFFGNGMNLLDSVLKRKD